MSMSACRYVNIGQGSRMAGHNVHTHTHIKWEDSKIADILGAL